MSIKEEHYKAITPNMSTATGGCFELFVPFVQLVAQVNLDDIAISLSRIQRFNGHTKEDCDQSVADHSLFVAQYLYDTTHDPKLALCGLLHDAAEYLYGDIPSPIKKYLRDAMMPNGLTLRENMQLLTHAVLYAVGGPDLRDYYEQHREQIDHADLVALATEKRDLLINHPNVQWAPLPDPSAGLAMACGYHARYEFLWQLRALTRLAGYSK